MSKKMTGRMHQDQQACQITVYGSSALPEVHKKSSFSSLSGIFVGLKANNLSDYSNYSANSPTSPLDFWVFPNPGRSPRSPCEKIWNGDKIGLGIIDCLDDRPRESSDLRNIVFRPQLRMRDPKCIQSFGSLDEAGRYFPKKLLGSSNVKRLVNSPRLGDRFPSHQSPSSLPKNFAFSHAHLKSPLQKGDSNVVFEISDFPTDSKSSACPLNSPKLDQGSSRIDFSCTIPSSASEIELSEDYTCVTVHGPNPKTTHIYGDCIIGCNSNIPSYDSLNNKVEQPDVIPTLLDMNIATSVWHPSDFLTSCAMCKKMLAADKDIYIYRGEKAFCSTECRSKEILNDNLGNDLLEPENGNLIPEADIMDS
ncbi:hypothetical protein SAY87_030590 [Trapa incisa]|uniref:FLZ-type domain-containing protein n=2 Tax=Trapa TaxID=22665 RepID=A0AAN7R6L8_TRANT|nr:hypothetical protein SAY87_030590 [Trapa incisa]KAK4787803.1 hypothetical protein SAY86_011636 [Trapa natans]